MSETLPGVRGAAALYGIGTLTAVVMIGALCFASGRHSTAPKMDSLRVRASESALSADSAKEIAANLQRYADAQHAIAAAAIRTADSAIAAAAQLSARVHITDATHLTVQRGDSSVVYVVPAEVPQILVEDSLAVEATTLAYQAKEREADTLRLEVTKLWQADSADVAAYHDARQEADGWKAESGRQYRRGLLRGALVGAAVLGAAKLLLTVLR